MKVAVVGASNKPDRYSYRAVMLLKQKRYEVYPVHPRIKEIEGLSVYSSLGEIKERMDTISLYVSADNSTNMMDEILNAKPQRIIFNPGAENTVLESKAKANGIDCLHACTLVLLTTGQF